MPQRFFVHPDDVVTLDELRGRYAELSEFIHERRCSDALAYRDPRVKEALRDQMAVVGQINRLNAYNPRQLELSLFSEGA